MCIRDSFQPDQPRPTFQLRAVQLTDNTLLIQGRSIDSAPPEPPNAAAAP